MNPFLTPVEEIVINLVLEWLGESRINRKMEEYIAIAHRFPKIEAAHSYVNERLERIEQLAHLTRFAILKPVMYPDDTDHFQSRSLGKLCALR